MMEVIRQKLPVVPDKATSVFRTVNAFQTSIRQEIVIQQVTGELVSDCTGFHYHRDGFFVGLLFVVPRVLVSGYTMAKTVA